MQIPLDFTPPLIIHHKQAVRFGGRILDYSGRASDRERRHVFLGRDHVPLSMTDRELLLAIQAGEMRFLDGEQIATAEAGGDRPPQTLALADDTAIETAKRRLAYCREWVRRGRPSRSTAVLAMIAADVAEERGETAPSPRTLQRWINAWLECAKALDALLPGIGGNRDDRLSPIARDLLRDTVERFYLVDTRPSARVVHRHVRSAFEEYNAPLPESDRLPIPSLKAVYGQIDTIDGFTLLYSRHGARKAAHAFAPKGSGPVVERHNQAWEIDHSKVDAIVIDEATNLPIGRPTVTVILDRYSRVIVGCRIGWEAPGANVVLDCLREAVLPKDDLLAQVPDMRGPWPCFGVPEVIHADQGREFKSRSFIEACLSIGTDVEYTPVLKPWYKGRVERFFRTLSRQVFHRVPGTTFANIFERNNEQIPDTVACVTLAELRDYAVRWIVDVYHRTPHRALGGRSPLDLWAESVRKHGITPPPAPDVAAVKLARTVYRRPQRYGIEVEGLLYNSADVASIRARPNAPTVVKVRVDTQDLTRIWVLDPATGQFIEVPIHASMRGLVQGISLDKHIRARAMQRENAARYGGAEGLKLAHSELDKGMAALQTRDGLTNRAKAARYWEKLTRAAPPEDAPAFDPVASARSIVDDLPGGMAPAGTASGDIALQDMDVDDVVETPAAEEADGSQKRGRTSGTAAEGAPEASPGIAPYVPPPDADDLDALLQRTGVRLVQGVKGDAE